MSRDSSDHTGDGGIFGNWTTDEWGLPAFEYTLDQRSDTRAAWDTLTLGTSTLHWHQLGNERITAIATDAGWVQLYSHEHGPRWMNHYSEELGRYAGGVSYLVDADQSEVWSTFYADLPADVEVRRVFGCGYVRIVVRRLGIELDRVTFAPFGDGRLLVSQITIRNVSADRRRLRHGEYWDVNLLNIDWNFAGDPLDPAPRLARAAALFAGYGAAWDERVGALRARHPEGKALHDRPFFVRASPPMTPDVVCAPLGAVGADGWAVTRASLFGDGGRRRPDGLLAPPRDEHLAGAADQEVAFLLTADLDLAPGDEAALGYAYGAAPPGDIETELCRLGPDPRALLESTAAAWRRSLPRVQFGGQEWLGRELAWGAYYLRSGASYHEGFRAHTISQGGAYQYLWGFNAGPRASCQHALSLVWLAPELAADVARFTMAETTPDGELPYCEADGGLIDNLPFRAPPSDGNLWLLWLISEYMLATRDRAFLRQSVSYWPAPYTRVEPVWDHCLRALDNLLDAVGIGQHGLLKLRAGGDWNDILPGQLTIAPGVPLERIHDEAESTLNTAMAVHVLRRFAELARYAGEPEVAVRAFQQAEDFAEAVRRCWQGTHVSRGWADREHEVGRRDLYLEPQAWALIAGVLGSDEATKLVREIRVRCSDELATRTFGPDGEGQLASVFGGVWLSINSTVAWGMAKVDPREGWRELVDNTLHHHATVFPQVWTGVWSGPDMYFPKTIGPEHMAALEPLGLQTGGAPEPDVAGWPYALPGASVRAWPVQIMFAHSEPLNATQWLMGCEPTASGLRVTPLLPFEGWSWDGGLLKLRYEADAVSGALGALGSETLTVDALLPSGLRAGDVHVEVAGAATASFVADGRVRFSVPVGPGGRTDFRITKRPAA